MVLIGVKVWTIKDGTPLCRGQQATSGPVVTRTC